jgi:hypothetical protein
MSLTNKKYSAIHNKTGSDKDLLKDEFDKGHINMIADNPEDDGVLSALVYQIQEMQEELDYLRTEISSNKDKATFPGFGTTSSTAMAGNTTTISKAQANAITVNTAKTSFPGLGTTSTTALAGDTKLISLGSNTTYTFSDMVDNKGNFSIRVTAIRDFGKGPVTKSIDLRLV